MEKRGAPKKEAETKDNSYLEAFNYQLLVLNSSFFFLLTVRRKKTIRGVDIKLHSFKACIHHTKELFREITRHVMMKNSV
jgi:hypothetical protein